MFWMLKGLLYLHMINSSENHSNPWTWWTLNFSTIYLIASKSGAIPFHPTVSMSSSIRERSFHIASLLNTFLMKAITWLRFITKTALWDNCWSSMISSSSHPPSEKLIWQKKQMARSLKKSLLSKERRPENSKSMLLLNHKSWRRSRISKKKTWNKKFNALISSVLESYHFLSAEARLAIKQLIWLAQPTRTRMKNFLGIMSG